jgi:hypothetical protein
MIGDPAQKPAYVREPYPAQWNAPAVWAPRRARKVPPHPAGPAAHGSGPTVIQELKPNRSNTLSPLRLRASVSIWQSSEDEGLAARTTEQLNRVSPGKEAALPEGKTKVVR